jgi:hypothetical protein
MRVVRRLLPLALLLVVIVAIAFVLTSRPRLEDARDEVEQRWDALVEPLDARYELLDGVTAAIGGAPGPSATLAGDVNAALERWNALRADDSGVEDAVDTANRLEALGRRLDATVRASARLSAIPEVMTALDAYAGAEIPGEVAAFTTAVRDYAEERSGSARGLMADLFGYDAVPALDIAASTSPSTQA